MRLWRKEDPTPLITHLTEAKSLYARLLGLLAHHDLPEDQAMLIYKTNSVHTFFMRFSLDIIFLNADFKVVDCVSDLRPWRITWPRFRARHVVELKTGMIEKKQIKIGDSLYVGH